MTGRPVAASVVIPAFNEAERIGPVLEAALDSELADEVVVVCDGCTDGTAEVAGRYPGVRVIDLHHNLGKGGAMAKGVAVARGDVIVFVDADLIGLRGRHVDAILRPVLSGEVGMAIGVFRGGKFWSDTAQRISPYISGQRAMRRSFFASIPYLEEIRMGVEVTINTYAKRQRLRIRRIVLSGVSNTHKERKLGLVKGTAARAKMYAEIGRAMVKVRKRKKSYARVRR